MTDSPVIDMPRPDALASGPVQEPPGDPHAPEREDVFDHFVFVDTSLTARVTEDDVPLEICLVDEFAIDGTFQYDEAQGRLNDDVSFNFEKIAFNHYDAPEPIDFLA